MTESEGFVLELRDIHKSFGDVHVLRGIDLKVRRGEVVAIIGPSGKGKSTLLKCIDLLEVPEQGSVIFMGKDYVPSARKRGLKLRANADLRNLRTHIGIVFQQFNLFPHRTVVQNVMMAPMLVLGMKETEARERSVAQLEKMGLQDKTNAYPSTLSGGQQQRVAIARALVMEPQLMLFDEVTSALDPELVGEVVNEIQRLAEGGMTMLVVTHHIGFARHSGSRLVFIDEGTIVEEGPPGEMLDHPMEARTREFLRRILI
jgi:ABC-type polar amino acid transport system ATPase subunit